MSNFPTSLDDSASLPNPGTTDKTNSPSHAGLHGATNAAVEAVEAKLGIGDTTPTADTFLFGTGAGESTWGALTSAQVLAGVSDETGTGSLVFGTAPTLNTPKVDTINENTATNGVTIDGLNIKDGKLNTNDSVVTTNITDGAVTNAKLNTDAGELGGAWTSYSSTPTGFSSVPSDAFYRYKKIGRLCTVSVTQPNAGTSNSTAFSIPLPFQAANIGTSMEWRESFSQPVNNGTTDTSTSGIAIIPNNATAMDLYRNLGGGLWTASGGKRVPSLTITYETAT